MRRYIALLRGVNISGKNKVPMAELKLGFEQFHGFPAVPRMQDRVVFFQDCFE